MPKRNSATDQTKNKKRYVFVQKEGDDFTCIKIVDGKFENVIYKYGKVGFARDENPDGTLPMKFDYDILSNPNKADIDSKEFIDYIGDMLVEFLDEKLKKGEPIE